MFWKLFYLLSATLYFYMNSHNYYILQNFLPLFLASKRVQKSTSVVNDEEDEWDEKAVKVNKITKRERSSSDSDDLADSDEEEEELDDSDDEPVTKRKRLGQGNKNGATSKKPDTSRPPLAPVRNYNTPAQGVATPKASSQSSSSQSNKSCLFDQCSAKQVGDGNTSNSTPYNGKSLSFQNDTPSSVVSMPVLPEGVVGPGSHLHNKLDFLLLGKKRDRNNNRPDHPQYNPRTCFIPPSFLKEQTPAMLQWWIIKQDNMDTVLFFKVIPHQFANYLLPCIHQHLFLSTLIF
jgi:DNA mismatch repair protein MSH6